MGVIALMTDMRNPSPLYVAIELIALPFVRPAVYVLNLRSGLVIAIATAASFILWWFIIFIILVRNMRKRNAARPA